MKHSEQFIASSTLIATLMLLLVYFTCPYQTAVAELNYTIQPETIVPYKVSIRAEQPSFTDTMDGMIAFTGKSITPDGFSATYTGQLLRKQQSRSNGFRRGFSRPPMPNMFHGVAFGGLSRASHDMTVGLKGNILKLSGQSQIPYLLGNLSILPFEPLPKGTKKHWKVGNGVSIKEEEDTPFFGSPFRRQTVIKTGASEEASFKIKSDDGELISIEKTYSLNSAAANADDESIKIHGTGTFVFNKSMKTTESLTMTHTMTIGTASTTTTIPVTVSLQRIPVEEWETAEQKRAERIAQAKKEHEERMAKKQAAAKEAAGKKLTPDAKQKILADLNSSHWPAVASRVRQLSAFQPHPDDFDIAYKIKELRQHKVVGVYLHARKLWDKLEPIIEAADASKPMTLDSGDNPFTPQSKEKINAQDLRQWSDDSGSFTVQATFIRQDGSSVILEREDGKQITVPIERLSSRDKLVLESLQADRPTPTNPFE